MTTTSLILLIFGIIATLEGLFIIIAPKETKSILAKLSKKSTNLRKIGLIELIVGIFLIVIANLM